MAKKKAPAKKKVAAKKVEVVVVKSVEVPLEKKRKIIPIAFNLQRHADILAFISEVRELKGISENKMIREILYHGKIRIERMIKEKRYIINPEDRA